MAFCKVIQNGIVIDVGMLFVVWDDKRKRFYHCDANDGQFILSSLYDGKIYRDTWMRPYPKSATGFENATIISISKVEYEDIIAQLEDKEIIPADTVYLNDAPNTLQNQMADNEETNLSISEMRRIMIEQQNTIQLLTNCLLSLSQEVYK